MQTHKQRVVIPDNHRLVVDVPEEMGTGPAELVLIVSQADRADRQEAQDAKEQAKRRWLKVTSELKDDPRPLANLTDEERAERIGKLTGLGRGLLPSKEEIQAAKKLELELENRFAR